jgi:hypothetical protein
MWNYDCNKIGPPITQAAFYELLTSAGRVRAQVRSWRICDGQNNNGVNIMFLDIFHHHFFLKTIVSETGSCLRLQVKSTQLGPIDRASPYLRTPVRTPDRVYKPSIAQTVCES